MMSKLPCNKPEISDRFKKEAEISWVLNQSIDQSHLGFSGSCDPPTPPPREKGPGAPRIPKWGEWEYCNTRLLK